MESIWIILITMVGVVSFVLALRSMKDFQDLPSSNIPFSLFLIRHKSELDKTTLKLLHQYIFNLKTHISLEKLIRGQESALVIYGPRDLKEKFPNLELLELEDYLMPLSKDEQKRLINPANKISLDQVLGWVVAPKNNPDKKLQSKSQFLKFLDLRDDQCFFWQLILAPVKSKNDSQTYFQLTIRGLVADSDPIGRVGLGKKIDQTINENTGLIKETRSLPTSAIFEDFKNRSLIPKEISKFILSDDEVLSLIS